MGNFRVVVTIATANTPKNWNYECVSTLLISCLRHIKSAQLFKEAFSFSNSNFFRFFGDSCRSNGRYPKILL